MPFYEFGDIKLPSIACWALSVIFGIGAITSSYLFLAPCLILLLAGIWFYNKERKEREDKERKEKEGAVQNQFHPHRPS